MQMDEPMAVQEVHPSAVGDNWQSRVLQRSLQRAAQRSIERSATFIAVARDLMGERGSAGFTIQEVADRAGQSLRIFYQHFASKDDLLLAVYEDNFDQHMARATAHVERYTDPLDRLAALIIGASDLPTMRPTEFEISLSHFRLQLLRTNPDGMRRSDQRYERLVRTLMREAYDAGRLPGCDVEHEAYFVSTIKIQYYFGAFLMDGEVPPILEMARFCLRGLGAELPAHFEQPEDGGRTTAAGPDGHGARRARQARDAKKEKP